MSIYLFTGSFDWVGTEPTHQIPTSGAEAETKVDALYNGGVLLFSREAIEDVYHQLNKPLKKGDTISVKGLDGSVTVWDILTGDTRPSPKKGLEYVLGAPCINYFTVEHLKQLLMFRDPSLSFCSLQISHFMTLRDKATKKPVLDPLKSESQTRDFLSRNIQAWEKTQLCSRLCEVLGPVKATHKIDKIVAFACGDISGRDSARSAFQHSLLVTLQELLGGGERDHGPKGIPCFAQDPIYSQVDRAVLGEYNIEVVDDPEGFLKVDDSSVIFSYAPNVPVKQIVADLARPAVLIWCEVKDDDGRVVMTDPNTSRVIAMIRSDYEEYPLPMDDHFGIMSIYLRRQNRSG